MGLNNMANRIRKIILASAVWLLIVISAAIVLFIREKKSGEYTSYNDYADSGYAFYITDNVKTAGLLKQMNEEGEITGLFSTKEFSYLNGWRIAKVDTVAENPYAVFTRVKDDGGRLINEYAVAIFNEAMQVNYLTPPFRFPMELNLTGFSASEDVLYLTAISDNGMQVYVYAVNTSDMIKVDNMAASQSEVNQWESSTLDVSEYKMDNSSSLHFFSEAEYEDDVLHIRSDNTEAGHFGVDETVSELYRNRKESLRMKLRSSSLSVPTFAVVTMIGIMLIILLNVLLNGRSRAVYMILVYEVLILILLTGVFFCLEVMSRKTAVTEYDRYASTALQGIFDGYPAIDLMNHNFFDANEYQIIRDRISRTAEQAGSGVEVLDLLIVNRNDLLVYLSESGKNQETVGDRYGMVVRDAVVSAGNSNRHVLASDQLQGIPVTVLAVSLRDSGYSDYVAVEIVEREEQGIGIFRSYQQMLIFMLVLFLIGTIAGIIFFVLQSADLMRLQKALGRLAAGDTDIKKPAVVSRDMNYMWNSLYEIQKNILQTNRIKFMTYEAYYRFAPKDIERILQKQSITEVQSGDAIRLNGTMAIVSTAGQTSTDSYEIERMNHLLVEMEECRKEHDGIFVSHDNDFSILKLLFLEKNLDTIPFGIELLMKLKEKKDNFRNVTVLMHYASFVYGVAGTEEQTSVYLSSQELSFLQRYADWFRSMRMGLIVTEELLEREHIEVDSRYIGFLVFGGGGTPERRIRLHEILDAESMRIHNLRVANNKKFASALESFYQQDFYLARSAFTEIVREAPDDAIAKWYLFECERYLNEAAPENFIGELHM